jgi:2-(1,2-epoxy-1,2-dihydrophenyl)acetyl-CoA isomerase
MSLMSEETVLYRRDDGVSWITLNRPAALNSIDEQVAERFVALFGAAANDEDVRCVVVAGTGRAFCAGQDVKLIKPFHDRGENWPVGDILRASYHRMIEAIVGIKKPVVAMMNGVAAGAGASLALACDFRIAAETAGLLQAFINLGLTPDCGSTYFLPRLVGTAKAMELAVLAPNVGAEDALRLGLVTKVVPPDKLEEETRAFALRLSQLPTQAIGVIKHAIARGSESSLEEALSYEAKTQDQLASTADHREGVAAFLEKRSAKFAGR